MNKSIYSSSNYRSHIQSHPQDKKYFCQECGKGYTTKFQFIIHRRLHSDDRPFKCSHCDKSFTSAGAQRKHEAKHSDTNRKLYTCNECRKRVTTYDSLKNHRLSHKDEKNYQCEICLKHFGRIFCSVLFLTSFYNHDSQNNNSREK